MYDLILRPTHRSGTADAEPVEVKPKQDGILRRVRVQCVATSAAPLQVSLDGGKGFYTLAQGQELVDAVDTPIVYVRGVGGTASYEAILYQ